MGGGEEWEERTEEKALDCCTYIYNVSMRVM